MAIAFICQLASGSYSAVGSFERPGQVDHAVDAVERAGGHVAHVGLDDLDAVEDVRERPAAPVEPVEDADAVAAIEQALGQDAADVAGAAGDEDELAGLGRLRREAVGAARERGQLPCPLPLSLMR